MMVALPWGLVGAAILGTASSVWYAHDYVDTRLASKEEVIIAGAKADYTLTKQGEGLLSEINKLEAKKVKTPDDRDRLKYLREELQRLQQIQRGK